MESWITRKPTRRIHVGNVPIGNNAPITVQSMTNTDTADAKATARQIVDLAEKIQDRIVKLRDSL